MPPAPGREGKGTIDYGHEATDGLHLVADDIEAARNELAGHGVDVSEVFHDAGGVFHHAGMAGRVEGLAPGHQSYGSFVSFRDPDWPDWYAQYMADEARQEGGS